MHYTPKIRTLNKLATKMGYIVFFQHEPINDPTIAVEPDEEILGTIDYPPRKFIKIYTNDDMLNTFAHEIGHAICNRLNDKIYHNFSDNVQEWLADIVGYVLLVTLNCIPHKYLNK